MNEIENILIVKIYNDEKKSFEFNTETEITIEEIKKKCQQKFNYLNENINNINLWFIDDDKDKNLINNYNDLITYAREIEPSKLLITLNIDVNKKIKEDNINKINEKKIDIMIII